MTFFIVVGERLRPSHDVLCVRYCIGAVLQRCVRACQSLNFDYTVRARAVRLHWS